MAKIDKKYKKLLKKILKKGFKYEDPNRKDVFRYQIPSYTLKHDFKDGFPAITTKQLYWKGVVGELLWFLRGDTNIKYLVDNNINIWNKDAYNYYCNECKIHNVEPCEFEKFVSFIKNSGTENPHFIPNITNYKLGDLGRVYGAQWRDWAKNISDNLGTINYNEPVDQISNLITGLKENPMGTRHIVTAWNPAELNNMALPPCHWSFEILVEPLSIKEQSELHPEIQKMFLKAKLGDQWEEKITKLNLPRYKFTLKWHQRSVDTFLGLPFNIVSYALLANIIGKMTNMIPKSIIGDLSNVHIYEPHLDAVKEQLSRDITKYDECELDVRGDKNFMLGTDKFTLNNKLNNLSIDDFKLKGYKSYPRIPAEMLAYNK